MALFFLKYLKKNVCFSSYVYCTFIGVYSGYPLCHLYHGRLLKGHKEMAQFGSLFIFQIKFGGLIHPKFRAILRPIGELPLKKTMIYCTLWPKKALLEL